MPPGSEASYSVKHSIQTKAFSDMYIPYQFSASTKAFSSTLQKVNILEYKIYVELTLDYNYMYIIHYYEYTIQYIIQCTPFCPL